MMHDVFGFLNSTENLIWLSLKFLKVIGICDSFPDTVKHRRKKEKGEKKGVSNQIS
jgi:hypothetical protein